MAKDYAKAAKKKPAPKKGGAMKPFLWGMVFGIALSAFSAWYFRDHWMAAKDLYARATAGTEEQVVPADEKNGNPKTAKDSKPSKADSKYKPLADDTSSNGGWKIDELLDGDNKTPASNDSKVDSGKPVALVCAAFSNRDKAEAMKAQIAMANGLVANVKPIESKGSTLYRVQLGPYKDKLKAEIDRDNLYKLGIRDCKIW